MSLTGGKQILSTKAVTFVALMSALGTVAAAFSLYIVIGPGTALDFSHLGTFIVAFTGGPILGMITGAIVGIIPAFYFANIAIVPGKLLTGFSVGIIYFSLQKLEFFKKNKTTQTLAIIIAGLVGYIPEMIFTIVDLQLIGLGPYLPFIIPKAWVEIIILTVFMVIILNYRTITDSINNLLGEKVEIGKLEYLISGLVIVGTFIFTFVIFMIVPTGGSVTITFLLIVSIVAFGIITGVIIYLQKKENKQESTQ